MLKGLWSIHKIIYYFIYRHGNTNHAQTISYAPYINILFVNWIIYAETNRINGAKKLRLIAPAKYDYGKCLLFNWDIYAVHAIGTHFGC